MLEPHLFKKTFYVFAFFALLFVASLVAYLLIFVALPNKANNRGKGIPGTNIYYQPLFQKTTKQTDQTVIEDQIDDIDTFIESDTSIENEDFSSLE